MHRCGEQPNEETDQLDETLQLTANRGSYFKAPQNIVV